MSTFEIAHIREQGQDMIIIPLRQDFGHRAPSEQAGVIAGLQACARGAGLAGKVVPVWDAGGGRMGFIAPPPWHPFFFGIDLNSVARIINKRLTCGD